MPHHLPSAAKAKNALATIQHYLGLASRNEPFDDNACRAELRDAFEELGAVIEDLCVIAKANKDTADRAANVASCLANGIQPD